MQSETRAPKVDILETGLLLVVPSLFLGVVATVFGDGDLAVGLLSGGLFGALLVSYRRAFYAVRTENGIERRRRSYSDAPADNPWVRLASVEYDGRYDRLLGAVLAILGVGAFAAIPATNPDGPTVLRLVVVGLFGTTCPLLIVGSAANDP
ncbi:hypothetical protein [Haladaptatus sp. DYF46]|uniref:hypothetical protein n=1 Tax=Haladaptatus sp. DYF46 TaxID=2886041 RepID=UPI001E4B8094|nr:hypothetical protein [Haladaptatus sp. DYF46]